METIKISVEVSVRLSENTQQFIKSLFAAPILAPTSKPQTSAVQAKSEPAQAPKPQDPAAAPASTKPAAAPVLGAPAAQVASSVSKSIEDVRKMLAQKVNEHRDIIKQKLNELGAPSVTKLDPSNYDEMYNFLKSL